jgi:glutathione S-transferase
MSTERRLYDLAGAAMRFSPYWWRTRLALAHKGLEVDTVPWRFTEKDAIADYLEDRYPDRPALFGGPAARALTRFVHDWTLHTLHPLIFRVVVPDLIERLDPRDRPYFRESREATLGMPFEALREQRGAHLDAFRRELKPLDACLSQQAHLCGTDPGYADYLVFGALQWARVASPVELLAGRDAVHRWRERLLDAFGGLGRRTPAAG